MECYRAFLFAGSAVFHKYFDGTPSDYGMIGMLAVFLQISQTFIDSGFSDALVQKKDRTETDLSTVFYLQI